MMSVTDSDGMELQCHQSVCHVNQSLGIIHNCCWESAEGEIRMAKEMCVTLYCCVQIIFRLSYLASYSVYQRG